MALAEVELGTKDSHLSTLSNERIQNIRDFNVLTQSWDVRDLLHEVDRLKDDLIKLQKRYTYRKGHDYGPCPSCNSYPWTWRHNGFEIGDDIIIITDEKTDVIIAEPAVCWAPSPSESGIWFVKLESGSFRRAHQFNMRHKDHPSVPALMEESAKAIAAKQAKHPPFSLAGTSRNAWDYPADMDSINAANSAEDTLRVIAFICLVIIVVVAIFAL